MNLYKLTNGFGYQYVVAASPNDAQELEDKDYKATSIYQMYVFKDGRRYKSLQKEVQNELLRPVVIKRTDLWLHPIGEGYKGCVIEFLDNGQVRKGYQE